MMIGMFLYLICRFSAKWWIHIASGHSSWVGGVMINIMFFQELVVVLLGKFRLADYGLAY